MIRKTVIFLNGYLLTLLSYSLVAGLFLGRSYDSMPYIKDVLGMTLYVFLLASATVFGFYTLLYITLMAARQRIKKIYWLFIVHFLAIVYVYLMSFYFRISSNFDAGHQYIGDYLAMVVGGNIGFLYLSSRNE